MPASDSLKVGKQEQSMQNSIVINQPQDLEKLLGKIGETPEAEVEILEVGDDNHKAEKVLNMKNDLTSLLEECTDRLSPFVLKKYRELGPF